MSPRVALVSCAEAQQLDADLPPLVAALRAQGIVADIVDWDNAAVDWSQFAAAIVRSAWDYHVRLPEYFGWIDAVSQYTKLFNSVEVLKWNCDKRYLVEVEAAGIRIIPTVFVDDSAQLSMVDLDGDVVLKPAVSAGANNTERFVHDAAAAVRVARSLIDAGHCVMVQPYQTAVDTQGEIGLVYMNGEFSHAFRKGAILGGAQLVRNDLFLEEDIGTAVATTDHLRVGARVTKFLHDRFGEMPLYVRVDTVLDDAGNVVIMEVEANEPSLFFATDSTSSERFARAIAGVVSVA